MPFEQGYGLPIYLFWSMAPICELRCSIPLGMESYDLPIVGTQGYDLPWYGVFPVSVIGNLVPALFWLLVLPRLGLFLTSFPNPIRDRILESFATHSARGPDRRNYSHELDRSGYPCGELIMCL